MIDFVIDDEGDYESSMTGSDRRQEILKNIKESDRPVSGSKLAKDYDVSRQVIVQDIALLRARNQEILSTNKGYLLFRPLSAKQGVSSVIRTQHSAAQTFTEMRIILEYGGQIRDVFVEHDLYGEIRADLIIETLQDAEEFCEKMKHSTSRPLKELTGDCHYHTITAPSEKVLQLIRKDLKAAGLLAED